MAVSSHSQLFSVEVLKQPLVRVLINHFWVAPLISLAAYLYLESSTQPRFWMELSFYPLFMLIGGLLKEFLNRKVPATFVELYQSGSLSAPALSALQKDLQVRLDSKWGSVLAVVGGMLVMGFYSESLVNVPQRWSQSPATCIVGFIIVIVDTMLGYAIMMAAWKILAATYSFRQLAVNGDLNVRPLHPDGCAGLSAAGRLYYSLIVIISVFAVFLVGWLAYAYFNTPFRRAFSAGQYDLAFPVTLVLLAIISAVIFFGTMMPVHTLMQEQADRLETSFAVLASRILEFEEQLLSKSSQLDQDQLKDQYASLESLRNAYMQRRKMPTWPIDLQTLQKLWIAQTPIVFSFGGSVLSLVEKLNLLPRP